MIINLVMISHTLSKVLTISLALISVQTVFAQKENDLLNRAFWKEKPNLEVVKQKVAEGHDPSQIDRAQFDATSLAINAKAGNDIIFYLLGQKGNDVNKKTHDGRTYMFWATIKGNFEVMNYLVEQGTNMKHVDEKGSSIMVYNAINGNKNTKVYDFLEAKGASIKTERNKAGASILLLISSHLKSLDEANYFISKGNSLQDVDDNGYTIFAYASKGGNQAFCNELIEKGIDPTFKAKDGGNVFMMATQVGRGAGNTLEFYQYLEQLGNTPNTSTVDGMNPLHNLARIKDKATIEYFIQKGCDVNQPNKEGNTPLMLAAGGQQSIDNFNLFFEKGANWNHKNAEGQTALTLALMNNTSKVSALLIGAGASVSIVDNDGNSLSYYLVRYFKNKEDYTSKLILLLNFGFKHNLLQGKGNTLYHVAVRERKLELLPILAEDKSISINALNEDGMTPLHLAASSDATGEFITSLIKLGADKRITTEFGETAYELATENELLQANGIDYSFLK